MGKFVGWSKVWSIAKLIATLQSTWWLIANNNQHRNQLQKKKEKRKSHFFHGLFDLVGYKIQRFRKFQLFHINFCS